ncbi:MAG: fumarylacetoacetate hydrolase family protein [Gammaproteobacteria bacterium]|nr:fumarylacetoacetate hydrolase family protein [Gammaproteobacteria bacterium]
MEVLDTTRTADILYRLRRTVTTIDALPGKLRPEDLAAGYEIQHELVDRLEAQYGGSGIGYKIACTNVYAQQLLNTDAPVFGRLSSCFTRPSPASIEGKGFSMLGIEPEFAFRISKDVPAEVAPYSAESIIEFVAGVIPAIELVGHRFSDWSVFDAPTLVADNAVHQAWIRGREVKSWRHLDLSRHAVDLYVNGDTVLSGSGANVLGSPLSALAWLASELPRWDRSLRAGDLVTTGTCTDVYSASIGDRIRADFGELGGVDLALL